MLKRNAIIVIWSLVGNQTKHKNKQKEVKRSPFFMPVLCYITYIMLSRAPTLPYRGVEIRLSF